MTPIPVGTPSDLGGPLPSCSLPPGEPDASSVTPMPVTPVKGKGTVLPTFETPSVSPEKIGLDTGSIALLPKPFTPSINKTLYTKARSDGLQKDPTPLPEGLTVMTLKGRLNGKKIKCGHPCLG